MLDAACATSPAEAARFSAWLRGLSHDEMLSDFGACLQHNLCALVRCHFSTGSSPNARFPQRDNNTALHMAAGFGSEDAVRLLLDTGASLDATNAEGRTALFAAALGGHARICSLLLARGADVKVHSHKGLSALHNSARNGHVSAIEVLVRGGAVLNDAANNHHSTPLYTSVMMRHLEEAPAALSSLRPAQI